MPVGERATKALHKKVGRGFNGYPVATVAYYGPDDRRASKVAVAIIVDEGAPPAALERWFNDEHDVRRDHRINEQIMRVLHEHDTRSVLMTDSIIGCPHEEGTDYPEGGVCPRCPFWAGRDRWAGERVPDEAPRENGSGSDVPSGEGEELAAFAELLQEPCPCGSGKTFGDCCAAEGFGPPTETTRAITGEIQRLVENRSFDSREALQAFLDEHVADHNRRGLDDFHGLSPIQMRALLYQPFETAPLAELEQRLPADLQAPVLDLFDLIAEAAADRGIKLTARGNLPLKLVKAADARLEALAARGAGWHGVRTERDVNDFHCVRVVAELAGLLRKARGYLYLTRRAEKLLDHGDRAGLYQRLLQTYCRRFNWAYGDGYGDLHTIQTGFGFSLHLLHRHGGGWRQAAFHEKAFLRAFPMVVEEADDGGPYFEPADRARRAWSVRTLHGLGFLFGLVELELPGERAPFLSDERLRVRAAPLLEKVFPEPPPA